MLIYEQGRKSKVAYKRASRWTKLEYMPVAKHNTLYDYADKSGEKPILCFFRHGGKKYAFDQFLRLGYPIILESGDIISGFDGTQSFKPYFIQVHPDGEMIRLWEEVDIKED
jgi:hypothetical protein